MSRIEITNMNSGSKTGQDLRYQLDAPMRKVRRELGLLPLEPDLHVALRAIDKASRSLENLRVTIRKSGKRFTLTTSTGPR